MVTVDIIIIPYAKKFTLKIKLTKWDQVSNINVWNLMVTVAEKGRMLTKLSPPTIPIQLTNNNRKCNSSSNSNIYNNNIDFILI